MNNKFKNYFFFILAGVLLPTIALAQNTLTFTNAAATGSTGPTQAQVTAAYDGTALDDAVTINTQGIQEWTVPADGLYTIEVWGAQGGNTGSTTVNEGSNLGGKGSRMKGDFTLTSGTVLKILVGQQGSGNQYDGGGGGGTFVVTGTSTALIIAGGGGGSNTYGGELDEGVPGSTGTAGTLGTGSGNGTAGNNGTGGSGSFSSSGSGLLTDGGNATWSSGSNGGGDAFVNGGQGGNVVNRGECIGGFGGGGSAHGQNCIGGGGGGGYS
ncbi:uncharacterized protein METZ01_LOCUS410180, partial [marine metagenome]